MNNTKIAAYGMTKFSQKDVSVEEQAQLAVKSVFETGAPKEIDAVLVSTNSNTKYLAAIISELVGVRPKISHTVENLCSSGTTAIVSAASYIESGLADSVLVVGADRFDSPGRVLEWDVARGEYRHPVFWASLFTSAYKRRFGATDEELAAVSAKNHQNAQKNPYAYLMGPVSIPQVLESRQLTDELRLYNCSRPCTGAAAVLLTNETKASVITDSPVSIKGIGQKTVSAGFTKSPDLTGMESTEIAAKEAFKMAGLHCGDIDVLEVHDAFSVCEPMALESIGMVKRGAGADYAAELFETGDNKVNPRGGLIGAGHPLGATGISQTIEIAQQLQGRAGPRQRSDAKTGLVHNMSAAATSSTVLILES